MYNFIGDVSAILAAKERGEEPRDLAKLYDRYEAFMLRIMCKVINIFCLDLQLLTCYDFVVFKF